MSCEVGFGVSSFELGLLDLKFGIRFEFGVLSSEGRRRWVAIPLPGSAHVAAGPRNPPTLWVRRAGAFTGDGIACTLERKLYGGRGLRLVDVPNMSTLVSKIGGFMIGK